jgi:histone H3
MWSFFVCVKGVREKEKMARTKMQAHRTEKFLSLKARTKRDDKLNEKARKRSAKKQSRAENPAILRGKWSAGTVALREICKYQKSTNLLLRKAPFIRLIRELAKEADNDKILNIRFQSTALAAIQEAVESYIVHICEDANLIVLHCRRTTVKRRDLELVLRLRGNRT